MNKKNIKYYRVDGTGFGVRCGEFTFSLEDDTLRGLRKVCKDYSNFVRENSGDVDLYFGHVYAHGKISVGKIKGLGVK